MTPAESSAARVRKLLAEVQADRRALSARTAEARAYVDAGLEQGPPERVGALALALDRAYTALESALERVARALEGGPPEGPDWHAELLRDAGLDIERVRPAVLGPPALAAAHEARRFRHFLRHAYGAEIDPARLATVAGAWLAAWDELQADLDRFAGFLGDLAARLEPEPDAPGSGR